MYSQEMHDPGTNVNALDQGFKELMSDSYILSNLLVGWLDEFKGYTPEEVRRCLPTVDDNRRIVDLNSEYASTKNGPIFLDKVFRVDIEEKNVRLIIGVEGQSDPYPGYPLENRALYYTARMISDQKGTVFDGDDYGGMQKVYSIWCILRPPKRRANMVIHHTMKGWYGTGLPMPMPEEDCDLMDVVFVYMSDEYEASTPMGLLNTLFHQDIDDEVRRKRLKEDYKIPENESLLRSVYDMSKTLDEQLFDYYRREGMQIGVQQGVQQGHQQGVIESSVSHVRKLVETLDVDAESAMDLIGVPDDIREEVRRSL